MHLNVARAAAAAGDSAWAAEEARQAQALAVAAGDVPLRLSADVATAAALLTAGDTPGSGGARPPGDLQWPGGYRYAAQGLDGRRARGARA